jgi:hypothetical protein
VQLFLLLLLDAIHQRIRLSLKDRQRRRLNIIAAVFEGGVDQGRSIQCKLADHRVISSAHVVQGRPRLVDHNEKCEQGAKRLSPSWCRWMG